MLSSTANAFPKYLVDLKKNSLCRSPDQIYAFSPVSFAMLSLSKNDLVTLRPELQPDGTCSRFGEESWQARVARGW